MSTLTIRKKGNKNFRHESPDYNNYGANNIGIEFDGDIVKLRSFSGRVIFDREGYNFADVTVFDDGGSAETFPNANELKQRLIALGYPFAGGTTEVTLSEIDGGTP